MQKLKYAVPAGLLLLTVPFMASAQQSGMRDLMFGQDALKRGPADFAQAVPQPNLQRPKQTVPQTTPQKQVVPQQKNDWGLDLTTYGGVRLRNWRIFCEDYPAECDGQQTLPVVVDLKDPKTSRKMIEEVNTYVNKRITYKTDLEQWGNKNDRYVIDKGTPGEYVDRWTVLDPTVKGEIFGDCDEYVILKRKMLLAMGFPRSALLMTAVQATVKRNGVLVKEGHMVLTVRTNEGDLILDMPHYTNELKRWWETGKYGLHEFDYRQSPRDQNLWEKLSKPVAKGTN